MCCRLFGSFGTTCRRLRKRPANDAANSIVFVQTLPVNRTLAFRGIEPWNDCFQAELAHLKFPLELCRFQLVEVRLNDVGGAGGGAALHGAAVPFRRSEEELRLIYSAVVVRAVNGLTGHEQKVGLHRMIPNRTARILSCCSAHRKTRSPSTPYAAIFVVPVA